MAVLDRMSEMKEPLSGKEPFDKQSHNRSHKGKHILKKDQEVELQASNSSIIDIDLLRQTTVRPCSPP